MAVPVWNKECLLNTERGRQSDGGSAFQAVLADFAKVGSSGDPLIELLTFLFFRYTYPAATSGTDASDTSGVTATPSR